MQRGKRRQVNTQRQVGEMQRDVKGMEKVSLRWETSGRNFMYFNDRGIFISNQTLICVYQTKRCQSHTLLSTCKM
jgi:hypothetical protein